MFNEICLIDILLFASYFCGKVLVCEVEVGNTNAEDIRRFSRFCAADCIGNY